MLRRMKFLLTTWEGGGMVTPTLAVAHKLMRAGHHVRVMSDACNRLEVEAAGAEFIAWRRGPSRPDRSRHTDVMRDWEAASPEAALQTVIDAIFAGPALGYARDVIDELEREPADLVVSCEFLLGVLAACEARGQALVAICMNVPLMPIEGIPPLGPGLTPARTAEERALHAHVAQALEALFDRGLPALNAARRELGLAPLAHLAEQWHTPDRILLATSRAFDFAPATLPEKYAYVGPQFGHPGWAQEWASPWPSHDSRPLVLVSFSTSFQNHAGVLQRLIDAAAGLPVRVLVTLGGSIEPEELTPAANTVLVHSGPHDVLMPQAAVVVTHGGHGTVTRALTHRRPLLIIPHGRDQNDNAVRVTARGAGLTLNVSASTADMEAALRMLLAEPSFRAAAEHLGSLVAYEAEHSPVVEELEHAALAARSAGSISPGLSLAAC